VLDKLEAVAMELTDCAYPLLTGIFFQTLVFFVPTSLRYTYKFIMFRSEIVCTAEMKVAFDNADVAIFLGALPRKLVFRFTQKQQTFCSHIVLGMAWNERNC